MNERTGEERCGGGDELGVFEEQQEVKASRWREPGHSCPRAGRGGPAGRAFEWGEASGERPAGLGASTAPSALTCSRLCLVLGPHLASSRRCLPELHLGVSVVQVKQPKSRKTVMSEQHIATK